MCNETTASTKNLNLENVYLKLSDFLKEPDNHEGFFKEEDGLLTVNEIEFDTETYTDIKDTKLSFISRKESETSLDVEVYLRNNFQSVKFNNCKFNYDLLINHNLDALTISKCIFEKKCYINNQYKNNNNEIKIDDILIEETKFKSNFKLHRVIIENFKIYDTDFLKNADFFKSHFKNTNTKKITFNAINFHELALFGEAIFDRFLQFKYVTFKGYAHFRSTTFTEGLDLEYSNIEQEMNFFNIQKLDTSISKQNTSQETYRIIKYQLQKVGSIIDSNKYHALELEKKKVTLSENPSKNLLEFLIFQIHFLSSKHSTDWFITLLWMINITFLYSQYKILLNQGLSESFIIPFILNILFVISFFPSSESDKLYKIYRILISIPIYLMYSLGTKDYYLKCFSNNINPFSIMTGEETLTLSTLIYKMIIAYLIYQFIISIRQNTRRS